MRCRMDRRRFLKTAVVVQRDSLAEGLTLVGNAVRRKPALRDAIQARFGLPCCLGEVPEEAAFARPGPRSI